MSGHPTSALATVASIPAAGVYGIAYAGQIFEAADPLFLGPSVAQQVMVDYLPSSGQWIIVAIL